MSLSFFDFLIFVFLFFVHLLFACFFFVVLSDFLGLVFVYTLVVFSAVLLLLVFDGLNFS